MEGGGGRRFQQGVGEQAEGERDRASRDGEESEPHRLLLLLVRRAVSAHPARHRHAVIARQSIRVCVLTRRSSRISAVRLLHVRRMLLLLLAHLAWMRTIRRLLLLLMLLELLLLVLLLLVVMQLLRRMQLLLREVVVLLLLWRQDRRSIRSVPRRLSLSLSGTNGDITAAAAAAAHALLRSGRIRRNG